ncbi:hypothetical protein [Zhihengliuella sp.]|uniref:hypothetical protein n=1 Tax=Zhihengliuella sp. TaxID=1954483 RepID=UPI00281135C7|nr:hypothetical protein [Zhihengliuella sp.]
MSGAERVDSDSANGALLMRVPGRARPQKQALKAFEETVAALKRRYKPEFWFFFIPKAEDVYRWRVQLECGCVRELFTLGKDIYPDAHPWTGPTAGDVLPLGEAWCTNDHSDVETVYRDVIEWMDRRVREFPADPEECPDDTIPEVWAALRQPEPHSSAFWSVRLSCGHVHEHVVTDVGWRPEDGPKLVTVERAAEMRSEFEASWSAEDDAGWPEEGAERDHVRKMLDLRWPRPEPEQECRTCRYAQRITGYQRIGWLVPKKDSKPASDEQAAAERSRTEARLAKVEAEARRLREQLGLALDE